LEVDMVAGTAFGKEKKKPMLHFRTI